MRKSLMIALALIAIGCKGDMGPTGPQGEQGVEGLPGSGTKLVLTQIIGPGGLAFVVLPEEVGTDPSDIPAMVCYTAPDETSTWLAVNDGHWAFGSPWCALAFQGDRFVARMFFGNPGWIAAFVVVY